jgi:uncharacterized membrane protein
MYSIASFLVAVVYLIGSFAFIASLVKALNHRDDTPKLLCLLLILTTVMSTIFCFWFAFWQGYRAFELCAEWEYWLYYFCMP